MRTQKELSKIQIQNFTFFPETKEAQIVRGGKTTWIAWTQKGRLVVKLKGFDNYYFCPMTAEVYTLGTSRIYKPLKKQIDEKEHYYWLFMNGIRIKTLLWKILLDNKEGIETFCTNKKAILNMFRTSPELN